MAEPRMVKFKKTKVEHIFINILFEIKKNCGKRT